jgi:hypothetical protein
MLQEDVQKPGEPKGGAAPRLPMRVEEVTKEWLTEALRERYPGVEVTRLEHGRFISGTGSKLQLKPTYNQAGRDYGLPPSLFAKGGFDWHEVAFKASYQAEARFFRDWRPKIETNLPQGYYGGWNDDQGIALMEDLTLRGVRFGGGDARPLSLDTVAAVLKLLARIHAPFWNKPEIQGLRSLGQRVGLNFVDTLLEPSHYARCLSEPRGSTKPKAFHDVNRVLAGLKANWAQADTGPQTFVHGDAHQGNMFFEQDGSPGYLDFQAYVRCAGLHDVNYMIVGSLTPEDRRANDRQLLKLYLAELTSLGVPDVWAWDEAWERFKRHTMHGMLWFTTPAAMQPIEVVEPSGIRFGLAAGDYDLANLLGI